MKEFIVRYYQIAIAVVIFAVILLTKIQFYYALTLMLELIVVIEVVRMIADFIEKKRVQLRFVIDIFIVFLIRDVVIHVTQPEVKQEKILFLLLVIFIFFIFRILTLIFSPSVIPKENQLKDE